MAATSHTMASFDFQLCDQPETYPPIMWQAMQDPQLMTKYNEMLQQSDFYSTLENPEEGSNYSSSPGSPTSKSTKVITELKSSIPDKVERRREQNRQSQRAYRDRKEKHQRELEAQIAQWKDKHRKLSESFTAQTKEVTRLKTQINELNSQISTLKTGIPHAWTQFQSTQPDFDLVPFQDHSPRPRSQSLWEEGSPVSLS